jgi:hypothetical protein
MMHSERHPLAGSVVAVFPQAALHELEFHLEDWWDRVSGKSWQGVPATVTELSYSRRVSAEGLPPDDEVVFGRIYDSGHLMHVSELPTGEVGMS